MKNNFSSKDGSSKMKGFYLALLSCVGILVLLGGVLSYKNFSTAKKTLEDKKITAKEEKVNPVNQDAGVQSIENKVTNKYLDPVEKNQELTLSEEKAELRDIGALKEQKETEAKAEEKKEVKEVKTEEKPEVKETKAEEKTESKEVKTEEADKQKKEDKSKEKKETSEKSDADNVAGFTDSSKMSWPLIGEILMDYSVDHVVYDKTLEMYRTNDSICISAPIGSQVKASAEGVVKEVTSSVENGNMVVIDNGNGWLTTYSQLQDNILVGQGDVVKEGQVIGGVGTPSKYSVLLGSHLELKVAKGESTVDPKTVLAQ